MTQVLPDVIVTWQQNDYGLLGRCAESVAHALVRSGRVRRLVYLEPPVDSEEPFFADVRVDRGVNVYRLRGKGSRDPKALEAVVGHAELQSPVHLNFGSVDVNWWFRYALAPAVERSVLVLIEPYYVIDEQAGWAVRQRRMLSTLARSSDAVWGTSLRSVEGLPGAQYLGHACDLEMEDASLEALAALPEPDDLKDVPRPRALYSGALSFRIDGQAIEALADSGMHVVVVGFAARPELAELFARHPRIKFLGPRPPAQMLAYYQHCDVGIVPHTVEAITKAMEPRKVYNYCAAGLRPVLLGSDPPPRLSGVVTASSVPEFVARCSEAAAMGRLGPECVAQARRVTWATLGGWLLGESSQDRPSQHNNRDRAGRSRTPRNPKVRLRAG